MSRVNRDVVVAAFLLVLCAVFFWASFDIRVVDYGTLAAATWPRIVLAVLSVLSVVYLVQSLRAGPSAEDRPGGGLRGWVRRYRNPLWCYALYLLFLVTLPVLGMLIGGILFVFALLTALGGHAPRQLLLHAVLAVVSIGAMWAVFTYALGVLLPQGEIFTVL